MKRLTLSLLLIVMVLQLDCDKSSSPTSPEETNDPQSEHLIITSSDSSYQQLANEITSHYNAEMIVMGETTDELLDKLKEKTPQYVIIILPHQVIDQKLAGELFETLCSINDDVYLDVCYGYITGTTVDEARNLFYRGKNSVNVIDGFIALTHTFDDDSAVKLLAKSYRLNFNNINWAAYTIDVNSTVWDSYSDDFLRKFRGNQLIFSIGHGTPFSICGLDANHFSQINLNGSIVLSGACQTGKVGGKDFIAHSILNQGADNYIGSIITHGWIYMRKIAEYICEDKYTIGQSIKRGMNATIDHYEIGNLNIHNLYQTDLYSLPDDEWHLNRIARIIPFGDPTNKPTLKSKVSFINPALPPWF